MRLRVVIAIAITAAAVRLIPLQWLHPLNWDELEFFLATKWIGEGRVPFRDFWEHHTPLVWFVFAPIAAFVESAGVDVVIALRWAQVPIWIVTFWLANLWMRGAGLERFARWTAMALALCSSLLMIAAVEYRVEALLCMLFMAALVLLQWSAAALPPLSKRWQSHRTPFLAGAMFCLAAWANIRFAPLIATTMLLVLLRRKDWRMFAGAFATLGVTMLYFVATGSFDEFWQQVIVENLYEKYAEPVRFGFIHRLLVPFGIRILATDRLFELAAVDVGGIAVLLFGLAGLVLALRRWDTRDDLAFIAVIQVANLIVLASMKFIYNYHFALFVVLMLPLIALVVQRLPRPGLVMAIVSLAFAVGVFASIFRGKEADLAYQDLVMRELHRRTLPGEVVWGGIHWAIHREPAYRFWFTPELARIMVKRGLAPPYTVPEPPAAVVLDHNALRWMALVQRELAPYFVRHYIPVWRNLWVPGMNARLSPGSQMRWIVPRDGTYRVFASPRLAAHPWFRDPFYVGAFDTADPRVTLRLPPPAMHPDLEWSVDPEAQPLHGEQTLLSARLPLKKGQRIAVTNRGAVPLGVILLPGDDLVLFRQPPPGATLEAATTRVTHVPRFSR